MKNNIVKKIIYLLTAIILLAASVEWIVKPWISYRIEKVMKDMAKGLYSIKYDKMKIGIFPPSIEIHNFEISPDGSMLSEIKVQHLYEIEAAKIKLNATDIITVLTHKHLWFKHISLQNPVIKIVRLPFEHSDLHFVAADNDSTLFQIKQLEILNGALLYYNFGKNEIDVSIENFKINTQNLTIRNKISPENIQFDNLVLTMQNLVYVNDSLYSTSIKDIKISQKLSIAEIGKIHYSPRIGKYQIGKQYQKNVHWNSFDIEALVFEQLDLNKLLKKQLISRKIYLEKPFLNIFSNNNFEADSSLKDYVLSNLYSEKYYFKIDTIDIHKGNILIENFLPNNRLPQQIHFSELSGFISDVWLSKDTADEQTSMHAQLKGYFQRVIPFQINSYPAHYPFNWKHSGNANFSSFKFARIAKLLKNEYGIEILDGECNKLEFDFSFENNVLQGNFLFAYQNLNFEFETQKRSGLYQKSNPGIIRSNPVKETIKIEKLPHEDIIDIWRKGIEKGIVKTVYPVQL